MSLNYSVCIDFGGASPPWGTPRGGAWTRLLGALATFKDRFGVWMRSRKVLTKSLVEVPTSRTGGNDRPRAVGRVKSDPTAGAWQLLMQGVADLVVSRFPRQTRSSSSTPGPTQRHSTSRPDRFAFLRHGRKGDVSFEQEATRRSRFPFPQRARQQAAPRLCLRRAS